MNWTETTEECDLHIYRGVLIKKSKKWTIAIYLAWSCYEIKFLIFFGKRSAMINFNTRATTNIRFKLKKQSLSCGNHNFELTGINYNLKKQTKKCIYCIIERFETELFPSSAMKVNEKRGFSTNIIWVPLLGRVVFDWYQVSEYNNEYKISDFIFHK